MAGIADFFANIGTGIKDTASSLVPGGIKDFFGEYGEETVELDGIVYDLPTGKTAEQVTKEIESGDLDASTLTKSKSRGEKLKEGLESYAAVQKTDPNQIGMSTPLTLGALGDPVRGGYQPLMAQGGIATFAEGGEGQSKYIDIIQQALLNTRRGAEPEGILKSIAFNEAAESILPPNTSLTRDPYGRHGISYSKDIGENSRVEFTLSQDEKDRPEARVEFSTNPEKLWTSILSKVVDRKANGGIASFQGGGYADYYNPISSSSQYAPRSSVSIPSKVGGQSEIYRYIPSEVERLYTQQAAGRAREMGLGAPSGSVLTAADPLSIEWNMAPQMMTGMEYANYPSDYGEEDSYYGGYGGYGGGGRGGGIADLFASFMQNRPSRENRRRQRKEEKQTTEDDDQRRQLLQMIGSMYGAPQDVTIAPPAYDYGGGYGDYGGYGGVNFGFEDLFDYLPDEYERASGSAPGGETAYPRMNGAISGPGSETSDDIPAMLSDGEFVTNAEALRGIGLLAGANKQDKEEQRMVGARKMYEQQREAQKFAEDLLK
jgi:molybdopterin-binding protein